MDTLIFANLAMVIVSVIISIITLVRLILANRDVNPPNKTLEEVGDKYVLNSALTTLKKDCVNEKNEADLRSHGIKKPADFPGLRAHVIKKPADITSLGTHGTIKPDIYDIIGLWADGINEPADITADITNLKAHVIKKPAHITAPIFDNRLHRSHIKKTQKARIDHKNKQKNMCNL